MILKILGSSSAGNCYLLTSSSGNTLMIEAGVHPDIIKKAIRYNLMNISGCLITHRHGDHAKYLSTVASYGINVYANEDTIENANTNHHRLKIVHPENVYGCGEFTFMPISAHHDVPCFSYLIFHREMGNTLFLTDSAYTDYKFINLNNILVECNYDAQIISARPVESWVDRYIRNRVYKNHLSLDTCVQLLKANDLSRVQKIVLIHLSGGNADASKFKKEIEAVTGKETVIAAKNVTITFDKDPF